MPGAPLGTPGTWREGLPGGFQNRKVGSRVCPRGRVPGPLLPRDVIHVTFLSGKFRPSGKSLTLHGQVIPDFISDTLLEGNMASILGDCEDPEGWRLGTAVS